MLMVISSSMALPAGAEAYGAHHRTTEQSIKFLKRMKPFMVMEQIRLKIFGQ